MAQNRWSQHRLAQAAHTTRLRRRRPRGQRRPISALGSWELLLSRPSGLKAGQGRRCRIGRLFSCRGNRLFVLVQRVTSLDPGADWPAISYDDGSHHVGRAARTCVQEVLYVEDVLTAEDEKVE